MGTRYGILLALLALGPGEFRGCGEAGDTAEPLPEGTFEGCLVDADCAPRMCSDVRCLAGSCEPVGDLLDRDGDGSGPEALGCGLDCDDTDATVGPGSRELCNDRDDDCDGTIDEGAAGGSTFYATGITSSVTAIAALDGPGVVRFLHFEATSSAVFARAVGLDGSLGVPAEVFRLDRGGRFTELRALANGDEVLLLARTDIGAVRWVRLAAGSPFQVTAGPDFLELEGQALAMDVAPRPGGWYLALDLQSFSDPSETLRIILDDPDGEPLFQEFIRTIPGEEPPLDVAALGEGFAHVFDGSLWIEADGLRTPAMLPGPLARRPLVALPDGSLVVGFVDDGGLLAFQRYDASGAPLGAPVDGPRGAVASAAELHEGGRGLVLVAPLTAGAPSIWLRSAELAELPEYGPPLAPPVDMAAVQVAWSAGGSLAVFAPSNRGGALGLAVTCAP